LRTGSPQLKRASKKSATLSINMPNGRNTRRRPLPTFDNTSNKNKTIRIGCLMALTVTPEKLLIWK
jgi:hypothetical protein